MLRELLTHNWRWKLFSLLLAVAVWFYIRTSIQGDLVMPRLRPGGAATADFVHEFPVARLTAPGDTNLYHLDPATTRVTVRGDFLLMQELNWDEFRVFVDLTRPPDKPLSAHVVRVTPPPGMAVVAIDPPAVIVRLGTRPGTQTATLPAPEP
jgi:YbbR domain-containing protein